MSNLNFTWSVKIPTKEGRYWFYGWPYGQTKEAPGWHLIEVMITPSGPLYALKNSFWDPKHEKALGKFTPLILPEPPDIASLINQTKS